MPQDFSGQNLRGRNFKGKDLTGANFSYADIRGANFTNAILRGADFTGAKAGLPWYSAVIQFIMALLISAVSGLLAAFIGFFTVVFFTPEFTQRATGIPGMLMLGLVIICVTTILCYGLTSEAWKIIKQTFVLTLGISLISAIIIPIAILIAASALIASFVAFLVLITILITSVSAAASIVSFKNLGILTFIIAFTPAFLFPSIVIGGVSSIDTNTVLFGLATVLFSVYIAWRAFNGDENLEKFFVLGVAFGASGGSLFLGADLTDANFSQAILKSVSFNKSTIFTRVYWANAKQIDFASTENSYLQNRRIRKLAVTLEGQGKNYDHLDLAGINLKDGNLQDASFVEANFKAANLQGANLSRSTLKQTQLDKTDLTGACLTGAYIENWGITSETKLDNVRCEYVYMHIPTTQDPDPRRQPNNPNEFFAEGDFTNFIKSI